MKHSKGMKSKTISPFLWDNQCETAYINGIGKNNILESKKLQSDKSVEIDNILTTNKIMKRINQFPSEFTVTRYQDGETLNVYVHHSFEIDYAECLTESSKIIPIPINLANPVKFTSINNRRCFETVQDLRLSQKEENITWVTVTQRFLYNSNVFEPGDILEIPRNKRFQKIFHSMRQSSNKNELTVVTHPKQSKITLPNHIKGNFKKCDSPYKSCYRKLSDLVKKVETPFLITVPIDTNTGEILNNFRISPAKYNKRLLVLKRSSLKVLVVTQKNDDRVGVMTLCDDDYIDIKENVNIKPLNEGDNSGNILKIIHKSLKNIYDTRNIYFIPEESFIKPLKKTKSFKRKFSWSNKENKEKKSSTKETKGACDKTEVQIITKHRNSLTSINVKSTRQSFMEHVPVLKRFSSPLSNNSYRFKQMFMEYNYDDVEIETSSIDEHQYLLPIVSSYQQISSPNQRRIFVEEISESEIFVASDDEVEIGEDGYVLVKPKKQSTKKKHDSSFKDNSKFESHCVKPKVDKMVQTNFKSSSKDQFRCNRNHSHCHKNHSSIPPSKPPRMNIHQSGLVNNTSFNISFYQKIYENDFSNRMDSNEHTNVKNNCIEIRKRNPNKRMSEIIDKFERLNETRFTSSFQ